jgi:hypothetical protein
MAGLVELARWWRQRQRQDPGLAARLLPPAVQAAKPRTQLLHVARTADGRRFLERRARELEGALPACSREEAAETRACLGSMLHLLGQLADAEAHLERAVREEGRFSCQLERVRRDRLARQALLDARLAPVRPAAIWEDIDRIDASDLSTADFQRRFADKGRPVIISGLVPRMFSAGVWTRERLRTELGAKTFVPRLRVPQSPDWASLEDAPALTVSAFLDTMSSEGRSEDHRSAQGPNEILTQTPGCAPKGYLFDWNLPDNAPNLCSEISIPAYFADDLLQQLPEGAMYRDAWPSLFVGPRGTRSGLHIDAFGSNFWMAVLEGTKRWKLFRRSDAAFLGPSYQISLDPTFAAERDSAVVGLPDDHTGAGTASDEVGGSRTLDAIDAEHMASSAGGWDFCLHAGEVLFVPAGCPHGVWNVTDSIAISANYVDYSNLSLAITELELTSAEDPRVRPVLDSLRKLQAQRLAAESEVRSGIVVADDSGQESGSKADMLVPWSRFKRCAAKKRMRLDGDPGAP